MKKTTTKILMAALSLIMALGIATGTTFAWFSLNNKVTVTGMTVTTQVGDNLLISATTDANPTDNSDYRPSMVATLNQLLEPVSSISGEDSSFYYTASTNVDGVSGDAVLEQYVAYDHESTTDFDTNYGTTGAKGYADYKFTLKAMNSGTAPIYLDITSLTLHYGDTATAGNGAFRVAVLAKKYNVAGSTYGSYAGITVLKPSAGAYRDSSNAVTSTSALAAVSTLGTPASIGTLAANETAYYEVTIRLWIEGEDTACTSDTFAALTNEWQLDAQILLQNAANHASTGPVTALSTDSAARTFIGDDTISGTTKVVNGTTYKQLTSHATLYVTDSNLVKTTRVYTLDAAGVRMIDVTNQYRTWYNITITNNDAEHITGVPATFEAYYGHMDIPATGMTAGYTGTVTPTGGTMTATKGTDVITLANLSDGGTVTIAPAAP